MSAARRDLRQDAGIDASDKFAVWVRPQIPALTRFAASLTVRDAVDDLTQETLFRAWQQRDKYDPDRGSAIAWLVSIMKNLARRKWRLWSQESMHLIKADGERSQPYEDSLDLRRAIDRLSRRQREAVILYYYVDLKIDDVALIMRCSSGTVKSTLADARSQLREDLPSYE